MKIQNNMNSFNSQKSFKQNLFIDSNTDISLWKRHLNKSSFFNVPGGVLIANRKEFEGRSLIFAKKLFGIIYKKLSPELRIAIEKSLNDVSTQIAKAPDTVRLEGGKFHFPSA